MGSTEMNSAGHLNLNRKTNSNDVITSFGAEKLERLYGRN